jgi:hypothetical protein
MVSVPESAENATPGIASYRPARPVDQSDRIRWMDIGFDVLWGGVPVWGGFVLMGYVLKGTWDSPPYWILSVIAAHLISGTAAIVIGAPIVGNPVPRWLSWAKRAAQMSFVVVWVLWAWISLVEHGPKIAGDEPWEVDLATVYWIVVTVVLGATTAIFWLATKGLGLVGHRAERGPGIESSDNRR